MAVINSLYFLFIEVDLVFVMARIVILNWEIPIGVLGL
jgi:hypothetical protein